jgi:hypothetical protein
VIVKDLEMVKEHKNSNDVPVYAYTDESGNTGNYIFDNAQPYFWTGTLLSRIDLDTVGMNNVMMLTKTLGVDELHGNVLGLNRLEKVTKSLKKFITKHDCRFVFTRVEKRHISSTKLVDTLIDSGINKAVSPYHYGTKFHRQYFAHVIVELLNEDDQEAFWSVYEKGDVKVFCRILGNLHWSVKTKVKDPRTEELLLDAITWGLDHPDILLEATRSDLDAPNMVAFTLLLGRIHDIFQGTNFRIVRFIHDEQSQFAKSINQAYELLKKIAFSSGPLSWMPDSREVNTYKCPIDITSSCSSVGLQIIDIILWLTKRFIENPWCGYKNCRKLVRFVLDRSELSLFSRAQLAQDVSHGMKIVNNLPLSFEDEERGRRIMKKIEDARKTRMLENT